MNRSSVLIVVAHPDDEVLGAGGMAAWCADQRIPVRASILSSDVTARQHRPEDSVLTQDTHQASSILGMDEPILGCFPNIKMNTAAHLDLVQFIEKSIMTSGATHIVTHHPDDLNDDHSQVSRACQAAARLWQRRSDVQTLRSLRLMEVPSSTDWSFAGVNAGFRPTDFLPLTSSQLTRKLTALAAYRDVMRPAPHPRSNDAITALSTHRGAQAGVLAAEAFQTIYQDVSHGFV